MSPGVTPLIQFQRRVPQAGRLRFGVKTERAMKSLETWRITSKDFDQISLLADRYGGTVQQWAPGRGRQVEWEVITESPALEVIVPPNALGGTPIYELWSAAGLQRRCDGVVLTIPSETPEGAIQMEQACICDSTSKMVCKPITRLDVLLPDIPFQGVWMMEAKGWNAAKELPGMVDMVVAIQDQGFARATLALEKRTKTEGGKTSHFMVPVLRTPATLNELAAGGARLMSIGAGESPSLARGAPVPVDPDGEVVEAELVDEDETHLLVRTIYGHAAALELSNDEIRGLAFNITGGETEDVTTLERTLLQRIVAVMERALNGEGVFVLEGRRTSFLVKEAS
jgi:Recombination directionality factor-like